MMDILMFFLSLSWKVLLLCCGWLAFHYVREHGTKIFDDLLQTLGVAIQTLCALTRRRLLAKLKGSEVPEDEQAQPEEAATDAATQVEAHIV